MNTNHSRRKDELLLTLCPQCLEDYQMLGDRIIRRADPDQTIKDQCCICQVKRGYDYNITTIKSNNSERHLK